MDAKELIAASPCVTCLDAQHLEWLKAASLLWLVNNHVVPPAFVAASRLAPQVTPLAGPAVNTIQTTNGEVLDVLEFSNAVDQGAVFSIPVPSTGTFTVEFEMFQASVTGNVQWAVDAAAVVSGAAADAAWGTAVTVTMAYGTVARLQRSAVTAAVTPSGTLTPGATCFIRIRRLNTGVSGNLAAAASLTGIAFPR